MNVVILNEKIMRIDEMAENIPLICSRNLEPADQSPVVG
jgi:hypothetical protein